MSISTTDRVEFTLTAPDREADATARAASRAFGVSLTEATALMRREARMRCRPGQFGRFIVLRVMEGVCNNRIQELRPKLIHNQPVEWVDVSGNSRDA